MLPLDDPYWSELVHAYGKASDVPELLLALASSTGPKTGYEEEPWYSLWSSLCHQGDVYTASYAAVPHIVKIACEAASPIDSSFLQLPAAIEVARGNGRGPDVPERIAEAYEAALARVCDIIEAHRNDDWDRPMLLSAAAALAASKRHFDIAEALLNLDDYWISKINDFEFD